MAYSGGTSIVEVARGFAAYFGAGAGAPPPHCQPLKPGNGLTGNEPARIS
jgi:hypothetical protein